MSELSVRQYLHNDGSGLTLGYDKSEADKVIAEKDKLINELRTELELWRDGSIISEAHQKELDGKRHSDYKRCLAMARYYENEVRDSIDYMRRCGDGYDAYVNAHIDKMKKRMNKWMEIAEKFKVAK